MKHSQPGAQGLCIRVTKPHPYGVQPSSTVPEAFHLLQGCYTQATPNTCAFDYYAGGVTLNSAGCNAYGAVLHVTTLYIDSVSSCLEPYAVPCAVAGTMFSTRNGATECDATRAQAVQAFAAALPTLDQTARTLTILVPAGF